MTLRKFTKYLTWFLFGLAILGGIGTLINLITSGQPKETTTEETVVENHTEEAYAKFFAKQWLTIEKGETSSERTKRLIPYIQLENIKWEPPTVSQYPLEISVENVERYEKDKETLVTLDVTVKIEGATEAEDTEGEAEEIANQTSSAPLTEKRYLLDVTVVKVKDGLAIKSEPTSRPTTEARVYTFQPSETIASGDIVTEGEQFVKNFLEGYFKGETKVDIQPFLAKEADVLPLNNFEQLVEVGAVNIYYRGQDKDKEPTEKYYYAYAPLTVKDPDTKILYTQKVRVYFTKELTGEEKTKVTYVLRS